MSDYGLAKLLWSILSAQRTSTTVNPMKFARSKEVHTVRQRFLGLCLPPLAFSLVDCIITLVGQSTAYWQGKYELANETSPTLHHLLVLHPAAFIAGLLVWWCIFVGIILLLPDTLALIVCIGVTFGHTVGVATWILFHFKYGYQVCNGLFLLAAVILGLGIRWGWRAGPAQEYLLPRWSMWLRWLLAAVLFTVGVYLFLWPRSV